MISPGVVSAAIISAAAMILFKSSILFPLFSVFLGTFGNYTIPN